MGLLVDTLVNGAAEMDLKFTEEQLEKFESFYRLLVEKNKGVNLTAIVEEKEVAVKHFIDSLSCLKATPFGDGMSLLDIGTGAGFPGIPLKIYCQGLTVTLLESLDKRVNFLKEVISELGLSQIEAIHARAEDIGRNNDYREKYDRVVARAVAGLGVLTEYCLPSVKVGGFFLAMKGPKLEEEIAAAKKAIEILGGEVEKTISLRLPFTGDERNLVLIRKVKNTPEKYPRRAGIPQKKPL